MKKALLVLLGIIIGAFLVFSCQNTVAKSKKNYKKLYESCKKEKKKLGNLYESCYNESIQQQRVLNNNNPWDEMQ